MTSCAFTMLSEPPGRTICTCGLPLCIVNFSTGASLTRILPIFILISSHITFITIRSSVRILAISHRAIVTSSESFTLFVKFSVRTAAVVFMNTGVKRNRVTIYTTPLSYCGLVRTVLTIFAAILAGLILILMKVTIFTTRLCYSVLVPTSITIFAATSSLFVLVLTHIAILAAPFCFSVIEPSFRAIFTCPLAFFVLIRSFVTSFARRLLFMKYIITRWAIFALL